MLNIIFWLCLIFTSAALVYIKGILNHEDITTQIEAYTESKANERLNKLSKEKKFMDVLLSEEKEIVTKPSSVFITLENKGSISNHKSVNRKDTNINVNEYPLEVFPLSDFSAEKSRQGQLRCA